MEQSKLLSNLDESKRSDFGSIYEDKNESLSKEEIRRIEEKMREDPNLVDLGGENGALEIKRIEMQIR